MLTKFEENEVRALVYQDGVSPQIAVKMRFITQKVLKYQWLIFVAAGDSVQFPSIFIVLKIKETCFFIFESITFS